MKTKFLLNHRYKNFGWLIFIPGLMLGIYVLLTDAEPDLFDLQVPALFVSDSTAGENNWQFMDFVKNNIFNELSGLILLIGSLLLVFSREEDEDEFIMKLRLESLLWSTLIYGMILGFAWILIFDVLFFQFMIVNMYLLFLLFIGRFNWMLYKYRKATDEE